MEEVPSQSEIITHWLTTFPQHRVPNGKEARLQAYIELLETMKKYNYDRPMTSLFGEIISVSVPQHYKPVAKKQIWTEMAVRDLKSAVEIVFPRVELVKVDAEAIAKNLIERAPIVVEEPDVEPMGKGRIKPETTMNPNVEFDDAILDELGFDK